MAWSQVSWDAPPNYPELQKDAIHVWRARLDQPAGFIHDLARLLSDDEQLRARSFHFEDDRRRFIASHGALRLILSCYLHANPSELEFSDADGGKPQLAGTFDGCGLQFNLSHSRDLAVYAVSQSRRVGIDVEYVDAGIPAEPIAHRFFSASELAMLRTVSTAKDPQSFFAVWTRKEAYAKALGVGLETAIDLPRPSSNWHTSTFIPAENYAASLAAESAVVDVRYYDFKLSELFAHTPNGEQ